MSVLKIDFFYIQQIVGGLVLSHYLTLFSNTLK